MIDRHAERERGAGWDSYLAELEFVKIEKP